MATDTNLTEPAREPARTSFSIRIFGVGNPGGKVIEQLIQSGLPATAFVTINTDGEAIAASTAAQKILLETKLLRGLGSGGDPDRGRALAEDHAARIGSLCEGISVVFLVAGLGGGAGTGISPVVARLAKEEGALVLAFVTTPFRCEGDRRQGLAQQGLAELQESADGVICLPNERVFKLINEDTSLLETFKLTRDLLAGAVLGIWRLFQHRGLIEIHPGALCELLRDRHAESAFAVAEALGPTRSREVMDKLMAHPLLDGGQMLSESNAVLVSLMGGPDLTMTEINRIMGEIKAKCEQAHVIMGAAIDETLRDRLAVTVIVARKTQTPLERNPGAPGAGEPLPSQLLDRATTPRPGSRFVPPPPALTPDKLDQLMARQSRTGARRSRPSPKLQQTQLPLEIVSKGRFDKSEPTIHKGEDLDVPTYIRRGVPLN
jgi:cell division protein FtsZ